MAFPRAQDYDFWIRCAAQPAVTFHHLPLPLVAVSHRSRPSADQLQLTLSAYRRLIDKMFDLFPLDRLFPELAQELQKDERPIAADLARARAFLSTALACQAPPSHQMFLEAGELLTDITRNTDSPMAWNLLGILAVHLRQTDRARAAFQRAHQCDPDNPHIRLNLARALESLPS